MVGLLAVLEGRIQRSSRIWE